jgi:hypothetical protein
LTPKTISAASSKPDSEPPLAGIDSPGALF